MNTQKNHSYPITFRWTIKMRFARERLGDDASSVVKDILAEQS